MQKQQTKKNVFQCKITLSNDAYLVQMLNQSILQNNLRQIL